MDDGYILGIPNYEVRKALYGVVIPALTMRKQNDVFRDHLYAEPFKGEGREVVALAIELDNEGKGMLDWKRVE